MDVKTEQEKFWEGEFGNHYSSRNASAGLLASNLHFFSRILSKAEPLGSIIEYGANIGMNIMALRQLLPSLNCTAVELNKSACEELNKNVRCEIYNQSILDFQTDKTFDFVLTKGVLIHINPNELKAVYHKLYITSNKYICIAEYYNPSPVAIPYRGHLNKLFKRDFAGEMLQTYSDLILADYGFVYHNDPLFPQDDITWFLLKKK